jgi:Zn finger protein HypA/HybF involved in hydrogenase expression
LTKALMIADINCAAVDSANSDADRARLLATAEHLDATEKLRSRIDELDRECDRLCVENKMRKEYAYVCEECKTHNPAVREARDRSLRSVTNGPKR